MSFARSSESHPLTLFTLIGRNAEAKKVIEHPLNAHLVSVVEKENGIRHAGLDIGFHILSKWDGASNTTLATIGRGYGADICVEHPEISRIQCCFSFNPKTGIVLIQDWSNSGGGHGSTGFHGPNAETFDPQKICRRVVVTPFLNTQLGMGRLSRNLLRFELVWQRTPSNENNNRLPGSVYNVIDPGAVQALQHQTRRRIRRSRFSPIGQGISEKVSKVVDVDTGRLMAVKKIRIKDSEHDRWQAEAKSISNLNHPHVVDMISWEYQNSQDNILIFMGLKHGSLASLIQDALMTGNLATTMFHHMLQALDYISAQGIIHRDVKPENILFIRVNNGYVFQLADFGLCNKAGATNAQGGGTSLYRAPEVGHLHAVLTHKVDMWSLFATMLAVLHPDFLELEFRDRHDDIHRHVIAAARDLDSLHPIQEAANFYPEDRASAAQMLLKHFDGDEMTTREHEVPEMEEFVDDFVPREEVNARWAL